MRNLIDKIASNFKLSNKDTNDKLNAKYIYTFKDLEKMKEIYVLDLYTRIIYYGEISGDILKSNDKQYISFILSLKTSDEHKYEISKLNIKNLDVSKTMLIEDHYFISILAEDIHMIRTVLDIRNNYIIDIISKNIAFEKPDAFDGIPLMGVDMLELSEITNKEYKPYGYMRPDEIHTHSDFDNTPVCK